MSSSPRKKESDTKQIHLSEKLLIGPKLLGAMSHGLFAALFGAFRDKESTARSNLKHAIYSVLRTLSNHMSVAQMQYLGSPTDNTYTKFCDEKGVSPRSEVLEDGTSAHWIGSSSAEKVIINFHGGGYIVGAPVQSFEILWRIKEMLANEGKDVGILFLSYDLAPAAQYPRQLQQAIALLSHTISTLKKRPSNIVLAGDSAGGNLVLAVLSHLSHPHPSDTIHIPQLQIETKFRGVHLTSPWVSFDTNTPSYRCNARKDTLSPISVQRWSKCFMGNSEPDYYNEPLLAPVSWWENLMTEEIWVSASKDEVFVDGIVEFGNKLKFTKKETTILITEGEPHNPPLLDLVVGNKEGGETARHMKAWFNSVF